MGQPYILPGATCGKITYAKAENGAPWELQDDIKNLKNYYNSHNKDNGQTIDVKAGNHTGTTYHKLDYTEVNGEKVYNNYEYSIWDAVNTPDMVCHWYDNGYSGSFTQERCDYYGTNNKYMFSKIDTDLDGQFDQNANYNFNERDEFIIEEMVGQILERDGGA